MPSPMIRLSGAFNRVRFYLARLLVGDQLLYRPDEQPSAEHRRTTEALHHSEERYKMLTRLFSDYVLSHTVDQDGKLGVEWVIGKSFEALTGYKPHDIDYWSSVHPDDIPIIRRDIEKTLANEKTTSETRLKVKNGDYIWISNSRQPIWDEEEGRVVRYYSVIKDITERKQMEQALRESESRQRVLLGAIPDLIFLNHRDGTYLDYHARTPEVLMLSPDEFIGRKLTEVLPEDLAQRFFEAFEQVMQTGEEATVEYELNFSERPRHFEARMVVSGPDELLTIVRDITERRQVQEQQFELALERERMRLLTDFIQGAAHEFRTPLSVINSSAYLMSRSDDFQKRVQQVRQIERYVNRITDLVDTMLTITRLEISNPLKYALVDVNNLFKFACQGIRQKFGDEPPLHCEFSTDLPSVMGDARYLSIALHHLLDNAYQFTPASGTITASSGVTNGHIWIKVCNTGAGIPEDELPNIFRTFWRQDVAHSTPGFGLGLPITRRIIELHEGTISISSQPGQHTCVHVTLPVLSPDQAEAEAP